MMDTIRLHVNAANGHVTHEASPVCLNKPDDIHNGRAWLCRSAVKAGAVSLTLESHFMLG